MTIWGYAIRAMLRRPLRSAAFALGIAAAAAMLVAVTGLRRSTEDTLARAQGMLGADAIVLPASWGGNAGSMLFTAAPAALYMPSDVLDKTRSHDTVAEATPQLFLVSAPLACCSIANTVLVGFEPSTDFTLRPWHGLDRPLKDDEIIAGSDILNEPGGRLSFYGSLFVIAAKLRPTGVGFMDRAVFIPMQAARRMVSASGTASERPLAVKPDEISAVLLRFRPGLEPHEAAVKLEYALPGAQVVLASEALLGLRKEMERPFRWLAFGTALQWIASLVLIAALQMSALPERRREAALFAALGGTRRQIFRRFMAEDISISAIGALFGIAGGIAGLRVFGSSLGVEAGYAALLVSSAWAFIGALLLGMAASALPLWRALRSEPFEMVSQSGRGF